jgi:ABC-type glycerol-3-phosphate transport system permease component
MKTLKNHWLSYLILLVATFTALFPLFWTVSTSIKFKVETYVLPPKLINFTPTAKNYTSLFAMESFTRIYMNSILITVVSTLICLIAGAFAAYALARRASFSGRRPLEALMIAVRALPGIVVILPLFNLGSFIGIYDNIWAISLIYAGFTVPFAVWLMTSFFDQIPIEIEEAARIDGAGTFALFRRVLFPIAAPGIVATGVFVALLSWNEFLIPVIMAGENSKTLPVLVAGFISNRTLDWGPMAAAATVAIIPIAIFTIVIQKWLVSGLSGGAVKE